MENAQLDLALRLPRNVVAEVTPTGLTFREDVTVAELLRVGNSLLSTRGVLNFALGSLFDHLVTCVAHKNDKHGLSPDQRLTEAEHYVRTFAATHNLNPKEYREILGVARFYRGVDLKALGGMLTFEHYREAMWGAALKPGAGAPLAVELLLKASGGGMSISDFRRHIRTTYATETRAPRQTDLALYSAVFEFRRYAKREIETIDSFTPERARLILADLGEESLLFIDALRALAKE